MYRRPNAADHLAHQVEEGREKQRFGVLALSVDLEEVIDLIGGEDPGQEPADHHGDGAFFDEGLENFAEHGCVGWVGDKRVPNLQLPVITLKGLVFECRKT